MSKNGNTDSPWPERAVWFFALLIVAALVSFVSVAGPNTRVNEAEALVVIMQGTVDDLNGALVDAVIERDALVLALQDTNDAYNTAVQDADAAAIAWAETLDGLVEELGSAEAGIDALVEELADLEEQLEEALLPEPTPEPPAYCYPNDIMEVIVIRDPVTNLWNEDLASIYEDENGNRIQYPFGVTFFVYEDAVKTSDGDVFWEVFGPLGIGLFVGDGSVELFQAEPDLAYCE